MINIWNLLLFHPLLNVLIALTKLTGSFGWSIIVLTIGLRVAMTPLVMPSLKASKKMQELSPELAALKEKFKTDKQGLVTAQAALYKEHGLNPAAGCLPQIVQILVLIALFNAFNSVLKPNGDGIVKHLNPILYSNNKLPDNFVLSTKFYSLDLSKSLGDVYKTPSLAILPGLLVLLSAASQFLSSKMMMPEVKAEKKLAKKTEEKSDDIMAASQEQMLYMFPLMTIVFGFQFPAGLVIYWFVFSLVSMVQQYLATGWGGLTPWLKKFNLLK